jgi:hypothetical protein
MTPDRVLVCAQDANDQVSDRTHSPLVGGRTSRAPSRPGSLVPVARTQTPRR